MAKKGGKSWLALVKRAFRSPTKDAEKKSARRREETEQEEEDEKREKRRWLFRKSTNSNSLRQCEAEVGMDIDLVAEQRHAIAVEAATTAAAEAAAATAQAAVDEIIRLTRPSTWAREHCAAIVIQTGFRSYLARRALRALKGIVKLQALVRGHNVRKQAKMTVQCMQALLRVQSRLRNQRAMLSPRQHQHGRKSMFAKTFNLWEPRYSQDIRDRKSIQSRAGSCVEEDWNDCPRTLEELDAILQARKEASMKRERTLTQVFNQQEQGERTYWPEPKWERYSSADGRETVKILEVDCYSSPSMARSQSIATPHHRASHPHPPATPSPPSKMKPLQVRSASPRCARSHSSANTPNFASALPNYMAATESAKARVRSQSLTRQRPVTPEKERCGSAKKRLSYPVIERNSSPSQTDGRSSFSQNLRIPSFKSIQAGLLGMEQRSHSSSRYADSIGGEISPCSTTDLRRWLK